MLCLILLAAASSGVWSFEQARLGRAPVGFEVISMGRPAARWVVERHEGGRVLAQTATTEKDERGRHSLALVDGSSYGSVELRARVRLLSEKGQAGLVFRFQDTSNYYLLMLDAERDRIRLFRIVDGNWVALHGEDDVAFEKDVWYRLKVVLRGPKIAARMQGLWLFDVKDRSLPLEGRIGFWSDDDTRAHFDDLSAEPPGGH